MARGDNHLDSHRDAAYSPAQFKEGIGRGGRTVTSGTRKRLASALAVIVLFALLAVVSDTSSMTDESIGKPAENGIRVRIRERRSGEAGARGVVAEDEPDSSASSAKNLVRIAIVRDLCDGAIAEDVEFAVWAGTDKYESLALRDGVLCHVASVDLESVKAAEPWEIIGIDDAADRDGDMPTIWVARTVLMVGNLRYSDDASQDRTPTSFEIGWVVAPGGPGSHPDDQPDPWSFSWTRRHKLDRPRFVVPRAGLGPLRVRVPAIKGVMLLARPSAADAHWGYARLFPTREPEQSAPDVVMPRAAWVSGRVVNESGEKVTRDAKVRLHVRHRLPTAELDVELERLRGRHAMTVTSGPDGMSEVIYITGARVESGEFRVPLFESGTSTLFVKSDSHALKAVDLGRLSGSRPGLFVELERRPPFTRLELHVEGARPTAGGVTIVDASAEVGQVSRGAFTLDGEGGFLCDVMERGKKYILVARVERAEKIETFTGWILWDGREEIDLAQDLSREEPD